MPFYATVLLFSERALISQKFDYDDFEITFNSYTK